MSEAYWLARIIWMSLAPATIRGYRSYRLKRR
jgi:hypothetical protein